MALECLPVGGSGEVNGNPPGTQSESYIRDVGVSNNDPTLGGYVALFFVDPELRVAILKAGETYNGANWELFYDGVNDLMYQQPLYIDAPNVSWTYGAHGNVLTQTRPGYGGTDTTTYYNASQYFAKASETDFDGHTTTYGVGTNSDPNIGNRGDILWVEDPGSGDSSSPSYGKQYTYTYNGSGQKLSETNLNAVTTSYTYGTSNNISQGWYDTGNLIQVVQDPGTGHLNRTTSMHYDPAGHVLQSTDPANLTSTFTYNTLGQPLTVATPAHGSAPAETISYGYDGSGRTQTVQDNRGTTTIGYENGDDRVSSVTDPVTGTTSYTYQPTGERATVTLPGGGTWNYVKPRSEWVDPHI